MAAVPVSVTLTFHVDPEAWELAYGEACTPQALATYFEPLDGSALTAVAPAAAEWVTDVDQTDVSVAVGAPVG